MLPEFAAVRTESDPPNVRVQALELLKKRGSNRVGPEILGRPEEHRDYDDQDHPKGDAPGPWPSRAPSGSREELPREPKDQQEQPSLRVSRL
jgi:hypothetical protein